jgi:hypothetical protein
MPLKRSLSKRFDWRSLAGMFGWLLNLHKCFGSQRDHSPEPETHPQSPPTEDDVQLEAPSLVLEDPEPCRERAVESGEQAGGGGAEDDGDEVELGRAVTCSAGTFMMMLLPSFFDPGLTRRTYEDLLGVLPSSGLLDHLHRSPLSAR